MLLLTRSYRNVKMIQSAEESWKLSCSRNDRFAPVANKSCVLRSQWRPLAANESDFANSHQFPFRAAARSMQCKSSPDSFSSPPPGHGGMSNSRAASSIPEILA